VCSCSSDWLAVQQLIKQHADFHQFFFECPEDIPWTDSDFDDQSERRIPFEVLDLSEAEAVFMSHVNALQQEQKKVE